MLWQKTCVYKMRRKKYFLLLTLCSTMMLVFLLTSTQVGFSGSQDYMDIIDQIMLNVSNSTDCWIPGFDLVRRDLEYRKVFQHVSPLRCKPLQPDLYFMKMEFSVGIKHFSVKYLYLLDVMSALLSARLGMTMRFITQKNLKLYLE